MRLERARSALIVGAVALGTLVVTATSAAANPPPPCGYYEGGGLAIYNNCAPGTVAIMTVDVVGTESVQCVARGQSTLGWAILIDRSTYLPGNDYCQPVTPL